MLRFVLSKNLISFSFSNCVSQNDASAPRSHAGRHQLLRPGALPVTARDPHPGRLRRLQPHREGGAPPRHPEQAALQRDQRRHELRWSQLQLGQDSRLQRLGIQARGTIPLLLPLLISLLFCFSALLFSALLSPSFFSKPFHFAFIHFSPNFIRFLLFLSHQLFSSRFFSPPLIGP